MRHSLLTCILLVAAIGAHAYSFRYGKLYYQITDSAARTVELTCQSPYHAKAYSRLQTLHVPATVTRHDTAYTVVGIGARALHDCPELKLIYLPEGLRYIDSAAFADCLSLDTLSLPQSIERIGDAAFYHCIHLRALYIPAGVRDIGTNAFALCHRVKRIVVDPDNPYYDSRYGCNAICETATHTLHTTCAATIIPEDIHIIGTQAYAYTGVRRALLPEGLTEIEEQAYLRCEELDTLYLPATLREIGDWAFFGCIRLRHVELPDSIDHIPTCCFNECNSLLTISVPGTCRYVGEKAFRFSGLRAAVLEEGVDSIGAMAFAQCAFLRTVTLPRSVRHIAPNALWGCPKLEHIYVADKAERKRYIQLLGKEYKKIITLWTTTSNN